MKIYTVYCTIIISKLKDMSLKDSFILRIQVYKTLRRK